MKRKYRKNNKNALVKIFKILFNEFKILTYIILIYIIYY